MNNLKVLSDDACDKSKVLMNLDDVVPLGSNPRLRQGDVVRSNLRKRQAIIEEQDAKADEGMEQTMREVPIGKGLSGGLKYLQGRGALKESIELGVRNADKKKSKLVGVVDDDDDVSIRIDRLDEFGRIVSASLFHYYVFFYFCF